MQKSRYHTPRTSMCAQRKEGKETTGFACNFGCLPFAKIFRKIRLESKWNTTFWVVLSENFREQQNIWKDTVKTRIQEHPFSGFRLIGFLYIGYFRWNQPESVLNFLLLKKCKGFTNYDEIHNFERKLNLRHTTLENKLHNRAFDWHPLVFVRD